MTDRRQVQAIAATVVLGLALVLFVVAVVILRSAGEVYGPSGWRWWADQTSYLILGVPVLLAVVGVILARRARRH
jgi:ABC-type Fe3+ transport system permease subunit